MSNETKETIQTPTEEELKATGPVVHSPEEAKEMLAKEKAKKQKPKAKPDNEAGALHAVGRAACKRHGLPEVWVTADGQCFAQENDARNHGKSLGHSAEPLKVEA